MQTIALIGFVQTLFYSLLIGTKKKKEAKDYLLVVFLLFVGMELLYRYLLYSKFGTENNWLVLFDIFYWALFGPITLFYILTVTRHVSKLRPIHILHLLPLIIGLLAVKNFLWGHVGFNSFVDYFNGSTGYTKFWLYVWEFSSPIYILYSLYLLVLHNSRVKNYFSEVSGKDVKWLFLLLTGFFIFLFFSYCIWFLESVFNFNINLESLEFLPAILTTYVFFMGFYGFKQQGILFDISEMNAASIKNKMNDNNKYAKSGLSETERNVLITNLKKIMEDQKPYLKNDLTISELATQLDTNFHKLSQVINESFQQNFYDFINTYRIKESKKRLKSPESDKYKIISIANDSGFSSKSSFYKAFRKNTGVTPGEYLKKVK